MISSQDILELQKFYRGFFIDQPQGNNAFSFELRQNKKIFVPPFEVGALDNLDLGREIAFSEIISGREINVHGLNCILYLNHPSKNIFIFDNHNHAFFFWNIGWIREFIPSEAVLVHVDQHKDMRQPDRFLELKEISVQNVFDYTNRVLNVGNFVKPALRLGIFSGLIIMDGKEAFEQKLPETFVLDVDMDIFSKDMAYIDEKYKIERIRFLIARAEFITIATSPFFMDQKEALRILKELLKSE